VSSMFTMELRAIGAPLARVARPVPRPAAHQVLVAVEACGVCRTDLHVVDGELYASSIPGGDVRGDQT